MRDPKVRTNPSGIIPTVRFSDSLGSKENSNSTVFDLLVKEAGPASFTQTIPFLVSNTIKNFPKVSSDIL